ncbi:uncharacterized protein C19orf44 homolog [Nematolebias whitei]|uniref:uncharacterized protein C19orf44 homolog n=1 Tax=Nematolebias whitei TaxID=451745 RepID=UPI00189BA8D1|nr:uncharacterized protein C19orf44 homolog [Nematolebias whitei]
MWNRSGRSSALDRAEALLSAKRRKGDGRSSTLLDGSAKTQGSLVGSFKTRSALPNTHTWFSDVPDLSSDSTASAHGAEDDRAAEAKEQHGTKTESSKDIRPQRSPGGGSKFLKKAPKPTESSRSPVSRNQTHQRLEPRYTSSLIGGSQAAALNRLSEIEKHVSRHKQILEETRQPIKAAPNLASESRMLETAATTSTEASEQLSAHSSSDQSQKKRFLKKKAAECTNPAAAALISSDGGGLSRTRSTYPVVLKTKSVRVKSAVSLESDEEDMKILLGDSVDSTDGRTSGSKRTLPKKCLEKELNSPSQRVQSPGPATAGHPDTSPPPSTASPSRPSSPFRFAGQAQVHFSPTVRSPSPSPLQVSPSLSKGTSSPLQAGSPHESLLFLSGQGEVFSLEELDPARPASEDTLSQMGSVSSSDFNINLMTLDEPLAARAAFTSETFGNKPSPSKHVRPVSGSQPEHQQEEQGEDMLHYQSDFESDSSIGEVSEHTRGDGDEDEVPSEVASPSDGSQERTKDDHTVSDSSCSSFSQTSNHNHRKSRFHRPSRTPTSARKALKDAASQTQPAPPAHSARLSPGAATLDLALSQLYLTPPSVVTHTISPERLEALSSFSPVLLALNEMLKQQLNMTRRVINQSDHLHSRLLQSLDPPNYKYTTLEDTIQNFHRHRTHKP